MTDREIIVEILKIQKQLVSDIRKVIPYEKQSSFFSKEKEIDNLLSKLKQGTNDLGNESSKEEKYGDKPLNLPHPTKDAK